VGKPEKWQLTGFASNAIGRRSVMTGLSDLAVQRNDVLTIRRMLDPYVALIAEFLSPVAEQDEREADVNSEQTSQ
jgi:hypothetical protein